MEIKNDDFEKIFYKLKDCQKKIHEILPKKEEHEKDLLIQLLHESFALCFGAFFQMNLYQKDIGDLYETSVKIIPHEESWDLLNEVTDLSDFNRKLQLPSNLFKKEFASMCIANAAFRLPSAGTLVSRTIYQLKKSQQCDLSNSWPYFKFFDGKSMDWKSRATLKLKKDDDCFDFEKKPDFHHLFLALLICLRDEYGHSEFHEDYRCRQKVIKNYYPPKIVQAEICFIENTINMISQLCDYHNQKKIDLVIKYSK